jgi:hypothetical protein
MLTVNVRMNASEKIDIQILDMTGKRLYISTDKASGLYIHSIPVRDLSSGLYFVKLQVGDKTYERKFVKQ